MKNKAKYFKNLCLFSTILFHWICPTSSFAQQVRLKDLVNIKGIRANKLLGYGVVFGLAKTGDTQGSETTRQTVSHMMNRMGIKVSPDQLVSGNFASVIATAELPPYAQNGDRIDVRISTNGDAISLAGGTLMLTPLKAGDGNIYALAQGPVVVGPADGSGTQVLTVARLPGGALIEREFRPDFAPENQVTLSLKKQDFTTNKRIAEVINKHFRGFFAKSPDPGTILVQIPFPFQTKKVAFLSELENLSVKTDQKAVVVLNERTGTVVMGSGVTIAPVTISHKNLSVKVSLPNEKTNQDHSLLEVSGVTVGQVIQSLNRLGVRPDDLIGILQAIAAAGALNGEIIFI